MTAIASAFPSLAQSGGTLTGGLTVSSGGVAVSAGGVTTTQNGQTALLPGLVAATPAAGYTMINGTGTIISWTAPNDGKPHRLLIFTSLAVTTTETGGQVTCSYTAPNGTSTSHTIYAAGQAATDVIVMGSPFMLIIGANTTFTITQNTALTLGASILFAEIWAS